MKKLVSLFLALVLLFSAALAEDGADEAVEEIVEDVMLDDEEDADEAGADGSAAIPDQSVFTPSYGSPWQSAPGASSYWTLPMDITDEEAVWNMLMEPITVVDIGKKKGLSYSQLTKQNIYMYLEPDEDSKIVGEITNLSQGVRVIEDLGNGWTHVECYSSSFFSKPATKIKAWNILVSGYVKSKYLRQVQPTDKLALVIDKLSQHLYVFQEGKMIAELLCSTGLVQWNGKKYQPYNETRSGEFLLINMTGNLDSDRLKCSYAIRFNAGDEIHEVPHLVRADGTFEYKTTEPYLGQKRSHGCIRIQRLATPEGINMAWIYSPRSRHRAVLQRQRKGSVLSPRREVQFRLLGHLLSLPLCPAGRGALQQAEGLSLVQSRPPRVGHRRDQSALRPRRRPRRAPHRAPPGLLRLPRKRLSAHRSVFFGQKSRPSDVLILVQIH